MAAQEEARHHSDNYHQKKVHPEGLAAQNLARPEAAEDREHLEQGNKYFCWMSHCQWVVLSVSSLNSPNSQLAELQDEKQ